MTAIILQLLFSALVSHQMPPCVEELERLANLDFYHPEAFVKKLQEAPLDTYIELRDRALIAKTAGKTTFEFREEGEPIVDKAIREIDRRLNESYPAEFLDRFQRFKDRYLRLKELNIPYHDMHRLNFEFMEFLSEIETARRPELTGRFHQTNSKNDLEYLLAEWPDIILFWTFQPIEGEFFSDTRTAPVFLIGGVRRTTWGDGFDLVPSEFAYHDLGHIAFMVKMDKLLKEVEDYTPGVTERNWEENKNYIREHLLRLAAENLELGKAAATLLFEALHERGFQYDLAQLKAQFETPRWVDVVKRKLETRFWSENPMDAKRPELLEEGRKFLLTIIYDLIEKTALHELQVRDSKNNAIEFIYRPPAQYYRGQSSIVELTDVDKIKVDVTLQAQGTTMSMDLDALSLALIPPQPGIRETLLTDANIKKMELLLWAKTNFVRKWILKGEPKDLGHITRIVIRGVNIEVQLQADSSDAVTIVNLDDIEPAVMPREELKVFSRYNIFKLGQVAYLNTNQLPVAYSLLAPPQFEKAFIRNIRTVEGHRRIVDFSLTNDGDIESVPLHSFFVRPRREIISAAEIATAEKSIANIREILSRLQYHDWNFIVRQNENSAADFYLQPYYSAIDQQTATGDITIKKHGREWFLNSKMTAREIRQTALLAAIVSAEHQVRRHLLWKNTPVGSPVQDHEQLQELLRTRQASLRNSAPISYDAFRHIMTSFSFKSGSFEFGQVKKESGEAGFYIQAKYFNPTGNPTDEERAVAGDEIYVSPFDSETVIIQKALRAMLSASKQEVNRHFLVDGQPIFWNELLPLD